MHRNARRKGRCRNTLTRRRGTPHLSPNPTTNTRHGTEEGTSQLPVSPVADAIGGGRSRRRRAPIQSDAARDHAHARPAPAATLHGRATPLVVRPADYTPAELAPENASTGTGRCPRYHRARGMYHAEPTCHTVQAAGRASTATNRRAPTRRSVWGQVPPTRVGLGANGSVKRREK